MNLKRLSGATLIVIGLGLAGGVGWLALKGPATPTPAWQKEPIVPTAIPEAGQTESGPADFFATVPPYDTLPIAAAEARPRFGVGVPYPPLDPEIAVQLELGWYLSWRVSDSPLPADEVPFWQMIRLSESAFRPDAPLIRDIAQAQPGSTWLIGNEPDVIWQDNVTPEQYARWYHELYLLLKESDPTSRVAIGGVTQPTPLRLEYLERVLAAYEATYNQPMPVEVWNIHNFILPEQRSGWGVDIPPGLEAEQGILYDLEHHDDLEIFKAQLINFRQWLADHGQRDKPLMVSEYGILMPADYGFGPERVERFMLGTYDFMLHAADAEIGYPADDNRLVQGWAWYSLADDVYPTGNLVDLETGQITKLGQTHRDFILNLP